MIITRCKKLVASARNTGSQLLSDVFTEATTLVYTNVGYNFLYAKQYWRSYSDSEELCARFICDARMYPELNRNISDDITFYVLCLINYIILIVHFVLHLMWCVDNNNNNNLLESIRKTLRMRKH